MKKSCSRVQVGAASQPERAEPQKAHLVSVSLIPNSTPGLTLPLPWWWSVTPVDGTVDVGTRSRFAGAPLMSPPGSVYLGSLISCRDHKLEAKSSKANMTDRFSPSTKTHHSSWCKECVLLIISQKKDLNLKGSKDISALVGSFWVKEISQTAMMRYLCKINRTFPQSELTLPTGPVFPEF